MGFDIPRIRIYSKSRIHLVPRTIVWIPFFLRKVQNVRITVSSCLQAHIYIWLKPLARILYTVYLYIQSRFSLQFSRSSTLNPWGKKPPLSTLRKQCIFILFLSLFNAAKLKCKPSHIVIYSSIIILLNLNSPARPVSIKFWRKSNGWMKSECSIKYSKQWFNVKRTYLNRLVECIV